MTAVTSVSYVPPAAHAAVLEDRASLRASLVFTVVILLGFGFLYSLAGAALGWVLFPHQATGSIVMVDGKARGSALVAQPFADARYFQPRPSAANYDPMAAAGSNMARSNPDLRKRIAELTQEVAMREGIAPAQVPGELVTQSGGGLDPHLSPMGAQVQVARVAKARGLSSEDVAAVVAAHTEAPQFGVLGEARINVLQLNLAMDALKP
jgi:K+-transporting ATPase ATPase C chain